MKMNMIDNKKIKLGLLLLLWFAAVAGVSFALGKYVLSSQSSVNVTVEESDYKRVYDTTDAEVPYDQKDGFGKYYIQYTGDKTNPDKSKKN